MSSNYDKRFQTGFHNAITSDQLHRRSLDTIKELADKRRKLKLKLVCMHQSNQKMEMSEMRKKRIWINKESVHLMINRGCKGARAGGGYLAYTQDFWCHVTCINTSWLIELKLKVIIGVIKYIFAKLMNISLRLMLLVITSGKYRWR